MSLPSAACVRAAPGVVHVVTTATVRGVRPAERAASLLASADLVVHDVAVRPLLRPLIGLGTDLVSTLAPDGTEAPQERVVARLASEARAGRRVVRLLAEGRGAAARGSREASDLLAAGVPIEVCPGTAAELEDDHVAGIPLADHGLGRGFLAVPAVGHLDDELLRTAAWHAGPVVVWGPGASGDRVLDALAAAGRPASHDICRVDPSAGVLVLPDLATAHG